MFGISDLPKNISTEKKNKTSGTDKTYSFLMISEGEVVSQFEVSNSKLFTGRFQVSNFCI